MIIKTQEYQWLEELQCRLALTKSEEKEIFIQRVGFDGELEAFKLISEYKQPDWQLLSGLRFTQRMAEIQVDLLLITQMGWVMFEVKNYDSNYHYRDGKWLVNGLPKTRDDFAQLNRTLAILKNVHQRSGASGKLSGKLLFINESDTVEIEGADSALFVKRAKLKGFMRRLGEDCLNYLDNTHQIAVEANWLNAHSEPDLHLRSLTDERYDKMRKGIYCCRCASFHIQFERYHICCESCGAVEAAEKAILRTICGYGILFPYKRLDTREVYSVFGGQVQYQRVKRILSKYFKRNASQIGFINPVKSFEYQFGHIKFAYNDKLLP